MMRLKGKAKSAMATMVLALAAASVAGGCASLPMDRAAGPGAYEVFCGAGEGAACYDRARAKCAPGQAVVSQQISVKMRRDLRVVCRAG
jgi:hypothetical protein